MGFKEMNVAFFMNCVSTHQLPLAKEVVKLVGAKNFHYVDAGEEGQKYQTIESRELWLTKDRNECETADVLYSGGMRPFDLFERRAAKGLKTFYTSERWFKPIPLFGDVYVPGFLRLLVPSYRKMVRRFVRWVNTDPNARILAIGPWAKKDFLQMGVKKEKIVDWGYFVAPSSAKAMESRPSDGTLKVLWAGRDIPLKHVKDIERAVALANKHLTSSLRLQLTTSTNSHPITFTKLTGVTPAEVRKAMREHDTFVFASNGFEGWGAVVSEALEEGMNAIGTFECGAPPTLLPRERLFHCGDVKALACLLEAEYRGTLPPCSIGEWTAVARSKKLLEI